VFARSWWECWGGNPVFQSIAGCIATYSLPFGGDALQGQIDRYSLTGTLRLMKYIAVSSPPWCKRERKPVPRCLAGSSCLGGAWPAAWGAVAIKPRGAVQNPQCKRMPFDAVGLESGSMPCKCLREHPRHGIGSGCPGPANRVCVGGEPSCCSQCHLGRMA
jgi:hypothetical protein